MRVGTAKQINDMGAHREGVEFAGGKVGADTRRGGEELAGGGRPRALEQPGRWPVLGAGDEGQPLRRGPTGHPARGRGDMQGDEQPHSR